jgi:hypothetical protein
MIQVQVACQPESYLKTGNWKEKDFKAAPAADSLGVLFGDVPDQHHPEHSDGPVPDDG